MATELSRDAEVIAKCFFSLGQTTLTFQRPHIIHPRMASGLDELTGAGMLTRTDDPRGPREWKPTSKISTASRVKMPTESESFPITTE